MGNARLLTACAPPAFWFIWLPMGKCFYLSCSAASAPQLLLHICLCIIALQVWRPFLHSAGNCENQYETQGTWMLCWWPREHQDRLWEFWSLWLYLVPWNNVLGICPATLSGLTLDLKALQRRASEFVFQ